MKNPLVYNLLILMTFLAKKTRIEWTNKYIFYHRVVTA